ncbi:MAG TPA: DUF6350 family protein [Jiangellaceae bacterium]|nr:DUF6350 family protein [Jiangellaceae bacterium]
MTDLLSHPLLRREEPAWGTRVPWLAGVLAAAWALVAGQSMAALPAVLVWIDEGAESAVDDPLRVGGHLWLLAHGVGLDVDGTEITIVPLGLSVLFLLLIYRAARWAAHSAGVSSLRGVAPVAVPVAAVYALGAVFVVALSGTPEVSASAAGAGLRAGLAAVVAATSGAVYEGELAPTLLGKLPAWSLPPFAGAVVAVAGLFTVGTVLLAASAVAHGGRISAVAEALHPDPIGAGLLAVAGAAFAPNLAVWAAAFALGPGFAMGAGTSVAPGGVDLGIVPALPALGALPASMPGPSAWLVLVGPVLVGVLTGVTVHRRSPGGLVVAVRNTAVATVLAAAAMAALAMLAGGSVGTGRLAVLGPGPWQTALSTVVAVGVPSVLVTAILRRRTA